MDYHTMSLAELKKAAKGRRIKQYYIMKRVQLIQLLSMDQLPESYKIEKYTIHELRKQASEKGMRGFWGLHRDDLLRLLYPDFVSHEQYNHPTERQHPQENQDNKDGGKELQN